MIAAVLGGVLAALLAGGGAAGAGLAPASVSPGAGQGAASGLSITMTTMNDGHAVSLRDPAHPGWAHLAATGAQTDVVVTVHLNGALVHDWVSQLDTPDAFEGATTADCRGDEEAAPQEVSCHFRVQAVSGMNHLHFHFSADHGRLTADSNGALTGGDFHWNAAWEVRDATGVWSAIAPDHAIALPATLQTALRYVVTNAGGVPFRVADGCDHRLLPSHAQLVCPTAGVRPAASLTGEHDRALRLVDVTGASAEIEVRTGVVSFGGSFSLAQDNAIVGQPVVIQGRGLPHDEAFAMQYRLDDQAVLVGASATRSGTLSFGFPLLGTSPGTVHVNVVHDGITIASLPLDVTLVPRPQAAAAPAWPWLLLIPLAGLVVLVAVRRTQSRSRSRSRSPLSSTEPRAPRPTDPYPDASPARPEPAAARPR